MIGIFWIYNDKIYTYKEDRNSKKDRDTEVGQVDYWSVLQGNHHELLEYSYDYIPRGRVLVKNHKHIVYNSREIIHDTNKVNLIVKEFKLKNYELKFDEHYSPILDLGFDDDYC